MSERKSEIVVYRGADQGGLVARGEPVTVRNAPAIVKAAGRFLAWVEGRGLDLPRITPGDVGAYLQARELSVPTKKLHLAALRRCFDRLVNRHACVINPAATV